MAVKGSTPKPRRTTPEPETPDEASRVADLAGIRLSAQDAAWVANKTAQRRAAAEAVRKLDYRRHEPANTFAPPRYD